jgi:CheY-like chemotaxis protein
MAQIILIEDNPADVLLLRHALDAQDCQHHLEVLEDGEQALRFVRGYCGGRAEPSPCVLILDLHLPKYDGLEVLGAIRKEPALAFMRVVVLTGVTSAEEELRILAMGARLYRQKPVTLEGLMKLGEEIIAICEEAPINAA